MHHQLQLLTSSLISSRKAHIAMVERDRELLKEGSEVPSRVRLREGPIGVRVTLGQPTIAGF